MMRNWLRFLRRRLHDSASQAAVAGRFRPTVEPLETRLLPATFHWANPAGGDFNTAANWQENAVPGPTDDAIIDLSGVTVQLASGSDFQAGSTLTIASGSTLELSGTYSFRAGSTLTGAGAIVAQAGSRVDVAGNFDFSGDLTVQREGDLTVTSAVASLRSLSVEGSTVTMNSGTTAVGTLSVVTTSELMPGWSSPIVSWGTLAGTANLTVSNSFGCQDGILQINRVAVSAGGTLTLSGGTLDGGTLANAGTSTWSNSGGWIEFKNGATLSNEAGGTFEVLNDAQFYPGTGGGRVTNAGTFTKSAGTGTTVIHLPFDNSGVVQVQTGTLILTNGATSSGTFVAAGGTTLGFSSTRSYGTETALVPVYTFAPGSDLAGSGTVSFAGGNATLSGNWSFTGDLLVSGAVTNTDVSILAAVSTLRSVTVQGFGTLTFGAAVGSVQTLSGTVTLNGGLESASNVSAGTLIINTGTTSIGNLTVAGTLDGSADVTVSGRLNWTGGSLQGSGTTTVAAGGTLTINGGSSLVGRSLVNAGTTSWLGTGDLMLLDGAVLSNRAGAVFVVRDNAALVTDDEGSRFDNSGTFKKAAGNGVTTIKVPFDNSGSVQVQSGQLVLQGGGSGSGSYQVAAGTALELQTAGTPFTLDDTSSITGAGDIRFSEGSTTLAGTYQVTGGTTLTGTWSTDSFGRQTLNPATVTFDTTAATGSLLIDNSATLTGNGDVTVTGLTSLTSGIVTGSGQLNANGGIQDLDVTLDGRTLNNAATATWTTGTLRLRNGAVVNNLATGTFDIQGGVGLSLDTSVVNPSGAFNNAGVFRKSDDSQLTVAVPFNNTGSVLIPSGTFELAAGGSGDGAVSVAAGSTLEVSRAYHFTAASSIAGAGDVVFQSAASPTLVDGTYNVTGNTRVEGPATVSFSGPRIVAAGPAKSLTVAGGTAEFLAPVQSLGGSVVVSVLSSGPGGTLNLSGGAPVTVSALTLDGTLTGSDALTVSGLFHWTAGALAGTGETTAAGTLELAPGGSTLTVDGRTLNNDGTATWSGFGDLSLLNGATFNNRAGAVFNDQADRELTSTSGDGVFNNAGTFNQMAGLGSSGTGTTTVRARFNNTGLVDVQTGTLVYLGNVAGDGSYQVAPGTTLDFNGPDTTVGAGATIGGAGDVVFSDGTTHIAGSYDVTGNTLVMTPATVEFLSDQAFRAGSSATTITNQGRFRKAGGTGVTTVQPRFVNTGAVQLQAGTFRLQGGGDSQGSFSLSAGAVLDFNAGTFALRPGSNVSGGGSVVYSGGSTTVAASYNISGDTTVQAAATVVFDTGAAGAGILTSANATFSPSTTYQVALDGVQAGTDYSQFNSTGTVALNDSTLQATLNFTPDVGTSFVLIQGNDITGTFNSLPDGARLQLNGLEFQITYAAGPRGQRLAVSSQVILTRVAGAGLNVTTLTLTASADVVVGGEAVTLTAIIAPRDATGTVFLKDNGADVDFQTLAGGRVTFGLAGLAVGGHRFTAVYGGDGTFAGSTSAPVSVTVNSSAPSATTLSYFATGTDAGGGPNVVVFDAGTGQAKFNFFAYDPGFTGGVRVALGDVNHDGVADVLTAPGPGGPPDVHVYDGVSGSELRRFFAFGEGFRGGLYLASGDVNADGFADIVVGADAGGGANVAIFDGKTTATGQPIQFLVNFFPYGMEFTGGVRVAAGDVNADGFADLLCGAGPGGGPNVSVISGADRQTLLGSFFPYDMRFTGGLYMATGDVNGDGRADIICGTGAGGGPNVTVVSGADFVTPLVSFFAYDPAFLGGVRVGAVDRNGDGQAEVVCVAGPGGGPDVRTVDAATQQQLDDFFAYGINFAAGLFVAGSAR